MNGLAKSFTLTVMAVQNWLGIADNEMLVVSFPVRNHEVYAIVNKALGKEEATMTVELGIISVVISNKRYAVVRERIRKAFKGVSAHYHLY